jgi:hypothetical protein
MIAAPLTGIVEDMQGDGPGTGPEGPETKE